MLEENGRQQLLVGQGMHHASPILSGRAIGGTGGESKVELDSS